MKRALVLLALAAAGCGSGSGSGSQGGGSEPATAKSDPSAGGSSGLDGGWLWLNADQTGGVGLTLSQKDGTYVLSVLRLTSAKSMQANVEAGSYRADDTTLYATPKAYSCPVTSDPPYSAPYKLNGDTLTATVGATVLVMKRNPDSGSAPSSDLLITTGCFQSDGSFQSYPVTPIH